VDQNEFTLANSKCSFLITVRVPNNLRATAAASRVATGVRTSVQGGRAMDAQAETPNVRTWQLGASGDDGAAGRILLVEDEVFVREVTSEVLRSAGYLVLTARDAVDAEQAYVQRCGEIDLLLTDVILPGENGRSFAERLRLGHPTLKILLVTGYAEQMGLLESGREECLAKPFSTRELLEKVKEMMPVRDFASEHARIELRPAAGNASPA
jgi:CheY-like chemotaxis protein